MNLGQLESIKRFKEPKGRAQWTSFGQAQRSTALAWKAEKSKAAALQEESSPDELQRKVIVVSSKFQYRCLLRESHRSNVTPVQ